MPISTGIPSSWKLPLFWATVDGTKAGNVTEPARALLVGQMFISGQTGTGGQTGTAASGVAIPVGSVVLAQQMFGRGSMLARMVAAFFASNTTQQLWCLPVSDPTGTAATGTITVTGPATASGTLSVNIAGQLVQIAVGPTDTASTIATNLSAQINSLLDLPVVATVATAVVTLTCKWKGDTGNDIQIIPNYLGQYGGQVYPTGVGLTVVAMATGTGDVDFAVAQAAAISGIQTYEFDYVGLPYTDAASMTAWNTEYGFGATGRWNYTRQQYGVIFTARRDTYAGLLTWGLYPTGGSQNSPVMSTMAVEPGSPSPVWEWAASYCALGALGFSDDPARPLQTLEFYSILPAQLQNRFTQSQLNSLVNTGLAIQAVAPDGNPMILREQTQYQLNSFSQADTAFGLLSILTNLQELLRRMKSAITSKYPRVKLIPDGTKIGPGQAAVTPTDVKAELIAEYGQAIYDGLASDMNDFKANLIVQINSSDPNRLDVLWPPQLAGQLRQFTALSQFRLLYQPQPTN